MELAILSGVRRNNENRTVVEQVHKSQILKMPAVGEVDK